MEIRRIRADEGPLLRELRLQMLADSPDAFEDTLAEAGRSPQASGRDALVGAVRATLWVNPERRRQGIGRALMEAVEEWAREQSLLQLRLWVTDTNAAAKALYISSGFDLAGVSRPLASNPSPQEIMLLRAM